MIVLVHVQHYDGVREAERRVCVRERLAVCALLEIELWVKGSKVGFAVANDFFEINEFLIDF